MQNLLLLLYGSCDVKDQRIYLIIWIGEKTVRLYLQSIDKDNHLTGDPPKMRIQSKTWLREDAQLFLQICNSIDSKVIRLINHCEFLKELMEYLDFKLLYGSINTIYFSH